MSLSPLSMGNLSEIAKNNNVTSIMVVANLENDQFSSDLGSLFLNNEANSDKLIESILATAKQFGFRDVHFDIEYIKPEDKDAYNAFLRKAAKVIKGEGYMLSTALAPKTSDTQQGAWYTAHDYRVHGEVADFCVIMTYEWGYSAGPPMPVSPIDQVKRVLDYAKTVMPAQKIMMGQNLYGYDWTLPYVKGGKYARAVSPQEAIEIAKKAGVNIQYDDKAQAPFFNYRDSAGKDHTVWFEDARSIQAKFNLIKSEGIRGISYWKLGLSFPQNWLLLKDNFQVQKNAGVMTR
jgi:spore germination protein